MIKPICLLLSLFSGFCYAQDNLSGELLMFRNGDKLIKQQVEYKSPNSSGSNLVWDYKDLKTIDNNYLLSYSSLNDSIIQGTEHRTIYNYELKNDSLLLVSFENPTTQFTYIKPELLIHFPLTRGKQTSDYFIGKGNYCNRLGLVSQGINSSNVDADGTLILPTGDTLTNVTRVHISKRILETSVTLEKLESTLATPYCLDSINIRLQVGDPIILLDTWQWYSEGYRYPVFEIIESTVLKDGKLFPHFQTAFYYAPVDQYYDLSDDYKNQAVRDIYSSIEEKKSKKIPLDFSGIMTDIYSLKFDKNNDILIVEYSLSQSNQVSFRLLDLLGRQLSGTKKATISEGVHQEKISLNNLPKGQYILQISIGNKLYGEKIIK